MPKVSVIIPAYNAMTYLPQAVDSVLAQSFTDFELLIVDDGSSDNITQWVSQSVDSRVTLISQENQGSAAARNTGIDHAQGEYIAFIDADDRWQSTKLEKQVQCLEKNSSVGLVNTWVINIDEQGNLTENIFVSHAEGEVWHQIIEENLICCGSVPMVRRCCFEMMGLFDQSLRSAEDWDMWIRIASRYSFAILKDFLVFYRQRSSSKSNNLELHLQHRLQVIDKTFAALPQKLRYKKNRAYGRAYLSVAWKPLLIDDYETALQLRQVAVGYFPKLRLTKSYVRLGLLLTSKRWLGIQAYNRIKTLFYSIKKIKLLKVFTTNVERSL